MQHRLKAALIALAVPVLLTQAPVAQACMAGETMPYLVSFAPGSAEIGPDQGAVLDRMLQVYMATDMRRLIKVHVLAVGDLDSTAFDGADDSAKEANFALGEHRAAQARAYLEAHGIPGDLIEALVPRDLFGTPERRRDFDQAMANGTRLRLTGVWTPEPAEAGRAGEPVPTC